MRREQSAATLDVRMACLDERRTEVDALAHELRTADRGVVKRSVTAAQALEPIALCGRPQDLAARAKRAPPPALAARNAAVRARLVQQDTLGRLGKYTAAAALAKEALAQAQELGFRPTIAQALYETGQNLETVGNAKEAKDTLERAATEADAVGDSRLRPKALIALIFVLGEGGTANIWFLRDQVLAALGRSGGDLALEAVLHINVATALMSDARHDEARGELERTLAILRELHKEHANNAEAARNNLAIIDVEEGKPTAAIAESNEVLDDIERSVGKLHPLRADAFDNRGVARAQLLDFVGAASDFAEARAIIATLSGPHGTSWALFAADEADALLELGRAAGALALATDALAAFEDSSPDSPELARLLGNVACADLALGRVTTALPLLERAVKMPSREAPLDGRLVTSYNTAEVGEKTTTDDVTVP